ncbi:SDR family oxidoreductase [Reinekea blandensis]|uniref:Putative NADH-ubiquinone oxidoreductase n=1 Tax=Reinekea blandensis MED297 TaxID=314283 RepID=A4BKJ1_9GAMM|nr:NAD(P)H-binding protein [Reinekea blandensis]EAR07344.1 putative NADH-ubiquinone oxidoreductase [Reinekea sp. MED297] [Reinekea blandensis MED297]
MKTVSVIGATGMLGQPVARALIADGFNVRILTRNPGNARRLFGDKVDIRNADLHDIPSLKSALAGTDMVYVNVGGHSKATYYRNHVVGTQNLLKALEGQTLDVIAMISSAAAHPEFNDRWDNHYKWEAEQLLKASNQPYLAFMPSWFMESLDLFVQKNRLMQIGPSTKGIHWVAADDYGQTVSRCLQDEHCRNKRMHVYGPETLTMTQACRRVADSWQLQHTPLPSWLAATIGRLSRDPVLVDVADLTRHYDRTGEKPDPDALRTTTTLTQWLLNRSAKVGVAA